MEKHVTSIFSKLGLPPSDSDHRRVLAVLAFLAKTVWFYTFTRRSGHRLRLSADALQAAVRRDFTGHERFLR